MITRVRAAALAAAVAALLASGPARSSEAELKLDAPFSDHAVVQRGQDVMIYGRAPREADVTVRFAGLERSVRSTADGEWKAQFPAQQAARHVSIEVRSGHRVVTARDVAIGDVFLCSGQSNMEFALAEAALKPGDRSDPADSALHLLTIPHDQARAPRDRFAEEPGWQTASEAGPSFSAICFLMGRELARSRKIDVGLIDSSWGATAIESWLSYQALVQAGAPHNELAILEAFRSAPATAESRFGAALDERWRKPAEQGGRINFANLHNAMIAPLRHLGLAGAVWYQGESNANRGDDTPTYRSKISALLKSWRDQFRPDLPVVIVQLAGFGQLSGSPSANAWPDVREAQRQVAETDPRAGLVVTIDVGERLDIHPPLKRPVAQRAARVMENLFAGGNGEVGPRVIGARLEGQSVMVEIASHGVPLIAASWGRPGPFIICGDGDGDGDGGSRCLFSDAEFAGDEIRVAVPTGLRAERVRYCYAAAPICNIFDAGGEPLGPFDVLVRRAS